MLVIDPRADASIRPYKWERKKASPEGEAVTEGD